MVYRTDGHCEMKVAPVADVRLLHFPNPSIVVHKGIPREASPSALMGNSRGVNDTYITVVVVFNVCWMLLELSLDAGKPFIVR